MTKYLFCCETCFVVYKSPPDRAHIRLAVDGVDGGNCNGKFKRIQDFLSMEADFKSAKSRWDEIVAVRKALILERNEIRRFGGWYDKPRVQQIEKVLAQTVKPLRDAAGEVKISRSGFDKACQVRAEIDKNRKEYITRIQAINEMEKQEDSIRHNYLFRFFTDPETWRTELEPYADRLNEQIQHGLGAICARCWDSHLLVGEFSEVRLGTRQRLHIDVVTGTNECAFSNRILTWSDRYELLARYVRTQWSTSSSNSVAKIVRRRPSPSPIDDSKTISEAELDALNREAKRLENRRDQF